MDGFGYKEQVYNELTKQLVAQNQMELDDADQQQSSAQEKPELPLIIGLDQSLVAEYQKEIHDLKKEIDEKQLMMKALQANVDALEKQGEEDQTILTRQAQDIEKYKRNMAKLQKENIQIQAGQRNAKQQLRGTPATQANKNASQNFRNTVIGSSGLVDEEENFRHSFKRSFNMTTKQNGLGGIGSFNQTQKVGRGTMLAASSTNWIGEDFEEKMKEFNDKFMENLTLSLTKQLGFDLKQTKEEAESKRRANIGSSFVE